VGYAARHRRRTVYWQRPVGAGAAERERTHMLKSCNRRPMVSVRSKSRRQLVKTVSPYVVEMLERRLLLSAAAPTLLSIDPANPAAENAGGAATYAVIFSQPVTGVVAGDFALAGGSGTSASPTLVVSPNGGYQSVYAVTVEDAGNGAQDLNLVNIGGIVDAAGTPMAGGSNSLSFAAAATYGTNGHPVSVAVGDFTGDGKVDLAVAVDDDNGGGVSVLLGNGDGTFQAPVNYVAGDDPCSVVVGDFTGDGIADLAVADAGSVINNWGVCIPGGVSVLLGNGDGTFQSPVTYYGDGMGPESVAVGDFIGDGKADLAVANMNRNTVSVLLGNGDGTFQPAVNYAVGSYPDSVTVGDFSGDGKADLAVADLRGGVSVLLGNGDGTFQPAGSYAAGYRPCSVTVGDFTGDGKVDLAVADQDGDVSVLLGNGNGTFQAPVNYAVGGADSVTVGDFTGTDIADLAVVAGGGISVLLGNGDGTFHPPVSYATGYSSSSITVGDFTGDGKADLAVANNGYYDSVSVLLNTTVATPNFSNLSSSSSVNHGTASVTFSGTIAADEWILPSAETVAITLNSVTENAAIDSSGSFSATFNTSTLPASVTPYQVTYAYGGDANFNAVTDDISTALIVNNALFQPAVNYALGGNPCSVAVGDFTGAGNADLVAANSWDNTVSVLLGNGNGTFQAAVNYAAGSGPVSVAVGDFTGDGNADLAVADQDGGVSVLLGNGDGTFQPAVNYAAGSGPVSVTVGDFTGDGKADLAVADQGTSQNNYTDGGVSVLLGNGDGTFQPAVNYAVGDQALSVITGDFTGDGKADLAVADEGGYPSYNGGVSVLLGNGDGTFQAAKYYATGIYPSSVAVGDFTDDGKADLAVANYGTYVGNLVVGTVSVLLGNGDGTFQPAVNYAAGLDPDSVTVGDFTADGTAGLAVADYYGGVSVLLGNGDGTFQPAVNYDAGAHPESVTVGDFTGDGKTDLVVANHWDGTVSVLVNNGPTSPFGNLSSSSSINYGTPTVTFSGSIAEGYLTPSSTETVAVTLNGVTENAAINSSGDFSATFDTSVLPASFTPYHVTYAYAGDANFNAVTDNTTTALTVNIAPAWLNPDSAAIWNAGTQTLTVTGSATITGDPNNFGDDPIIYDSGNTGNLTVDTQVADGGDGDALVHLAAISGNGTTTMNGTNVDIAGNFTQAALVNNGSVEIDGTGAIGQLTGSGNLAIGNGTSDNTVQLTPAAIADSVTNAQASVTIGVGSTLDMTDNMLLLNYGNGSTPLAAVQAAVAYGARISGASSGYGSIISSTTNAGNPGQYAVGYADSTELTSIASGNVEVMYTLAGDANLDGKVNFNDFSILQNNYGQIGTDWSQGDWKHCGATNFVDLSCLENRYGETVEVMPTLTWTAPAAITYGTALSSTQLDATASVPGTFTYSPALGTVPTIGQQVLSVIFTPTDTTDYYAATTSVNLTVNQAATTTAVTSSNSSASLGQAVTFTATITPVTGSGENGTVQFQIDGGNLGSPVALALNGNTASYTTQTLAAGTHTITAIYSGDGSFTGSTSPAFIEHINSAITPTVTYTLSINDDGTGHYCAGSFALYATDSSNNGGLASYQVCVSGYQSITNYAPQGIYDDGTGGGGMDQIGFTLLRTSDNTSPATGSQDTVHAADGNIDVILVYGFGQTAGNLNTLKNANSTSTYDTAQVVYGAPLELLKGTFSSGTPSFTSQASDTGNVFVTNSGYATEAPILAFNTVTLVSSTVSQSTAVATTAAAASSAAEPIYSVYSPATKGIFNTGDASDTLVRQDESSQGSVIRYVL